MFNLFVLQLLFLSWQRQKGLDNLHAKNNSFLTAVYSAGQDFCAVSPAVVTLVNIVIGFGLCVS